METKLPAIETPSSIMKLAYLYSKIRFGKVLSSLKVVYARLPLAFSFFTNRISKLEKKLTLPAELAMLIRHHVAQINTCSFCMDIGIALAIDGNEHSDKFYHLDEYKVSWRYSEAEKAALLFAEELTKDKKVSDKTFAEAKRHFTERQLVEIAWLVATEHYYNIMHLAFDVHSDNLCQLKGRADKALVH